MKSFLNDQQNGYCYESAILIFGNLSLKGQFITFLLVTKRFGVHELWNTCHIGRKQLIIFRHNLENVHSHHSKEQRFH